MEKIEILYKKKSFSVGRLNQLAAMLNDVGELKKYPDYCIFAAGAFARYEADEESGADLFFIRLGSIREERVPKLSEILIAADLIRIVQKIGFPPLSNDGESLNTIYVDDLIAHIGTPEDESMGFFNARILFLLESVPVYNSDYYAKIAKIIISNYFNSCHGDYSNFRSFFMISDIIRYWKTICLDFEHGENNNAINNGTSFWLKHKNLKLFFSKRLTCYSFIFQLIVKNEILDNESVFEILQMKPVDRLFALAEARPDLSLLIEKISKLYFWFLELLNQKEEDLQNYLLVDKEWVDDFNRSRLDFHQKMSELFLAITTKTPQILKYLIV